MVDTPEKAHESLSPNHLRSIHHHLCLFIPAKQNVWTVQSAERIPDPEMATIGK
jgi:hypothetical protein